MEQLKEKIEQFFKVYKKEISIKNLIKNLNINIEEYNILIEVLYELEKEGKIYSQSNGNYMHVPTDFYLYHGILKKSLKQKYYIKLKKGLIITIPDKNLNGAAQNDIVFVDVKKGIKHDKQLIGNVVRVVERLKLDESDTISKGYIKKDFSRNCYYVDINDKKFYLSDKDLNGAYPNDLVSIQTFKDKSCKVVQILKRDHTQHVLQCKKINDDIVWVSIVNPELQFNVEIKKDYIFELDDCILVELDEKNNAQFIRKLETMKDLNSYIKNLLYDFGFYLDLSKKSKEEIKKLSKTIEDKDMINRIDLRKLTTVTIDSESAKDLDDAISLEYKNDRYYLYVHIADVTHYVKFDSALFCDAYLKGTSIYPANMVFPMLCEELANEICSLNPNEDKLTKTCLIEFDKDGNILDYSIFNSIIRSDCKMSYNNVNKVLTNNEIIEGYEPYIELLNKMNDLSNLLQRKRLERGFICFESNEFEFDIVDNSSVENISIRNHGLAHLMIENFMLIANEIIASIVYYYKAPFIYRNHEMPSVDQLMKLKHDLKSFKLYLNTLKNAQNPKILQKILLSICKNKDNVEKVYLSKLILSCMDRAHYDAFNIGHYALALDYYATFTSPIRRFPDLLNHYILEKIINGDIEDLDFYQKRYEEMCSKCNSTRLAAEKFEQYISYELLKSYISKYANDIFVAKIIFIKENEIYVKVDNLLYGTIKVTKNLIKDNNIFIDEKTYSCGDFIDVKIDGVKENSNEICFSIVRKEKKLNNKVRKKEYNDKY